MHSEVTHRTKLRALFRQRWLNSENGIRVVAHLLWVNVAMRSLWPSPAKLLCECLLLCFHETCGMWL